MTIKSINIKTIRIDGDTQSRVALSPDAVADYAAALEDDKELPPVVVFFDGADNWMADGFHRLHAYMTRQRASIPADVRIGTQRDAILYACGANSAHGLQRTNDDKRKAVGVLLADAEWSKMSDREIARLCNVSNHLVASVRNPPAPMPEPSGNSPTPPKPKQGGATAGTPTGDTTPPAPPTPPAPTDAEKNAADAHGDTSITQLLEETQAELVTAQGLLAAAAADDQKAETMKWRNVAATASRRENEVLATLLDRERELKQHVNTIRRIGRAVGEEDPAKVAATVELFVKNAAVAA